VPDFTGRVMVKLREDVDVPYQDAVQTQLPPDDLDAWNSVSDQFGGQLSLDRALQEFDPATVQSLVDQARAAAGGDLPSLTRYFAIVPPEGTDLEALAAAVGALSFTEFAYAEEQTTLPSPSQTPNDPEFPNETYLQPAPSGVNAPAAWLVPNGDGAGARLVDIEESWSLTHRDLPSIGTSAAGFPKANFEHGTNVLGIIIALGDNGQDCVGLAPATATDVVSIFRLAGGVFQLQSAIVAAVLLLLPLPENGPTLVLLIEQQSGAGGRG
jgi:hypothetical protein